jgi:hypothetical protein
MRVSAAADQDIGGECLIWRGDLPILNVDPRPGGGCGDLRPTLDAELPEHRRDVVIDRPR